MLDRPSRRLQALSAGLYWGGGVLIAVMIVYFIFPASNYLVNPIALGILGATASIDGRLLNETLLQIYWGKDWRRRLLPWATVMNIALIPIISGLIIESWAWIFAIGDVVFIVSLFGCVNEVLVAREVASDEVTQKAGSGIGIMRHAYVVGVEYLGTITALFLGLCLVLVFVGWPIGLAFGMSLLVALAVALYLDRNWFRPRWRQAISSRRSS